MIRFAVLLAVLVLCSIGNASIIVQSSFDFGDEGWRGGDFFDADGDEVPQFIAAGGQSGGFIRLTDFVAWTAFQAPASYLGDQSAAYLGSLRVFERVVLSDGVPAPVVVIGDGTLTLQFYVTQPADELWTRYSVPFVASAGWQVGNGTYNVGPAATEGQLQQVLYNLQFLNLNADWKTGVADSVDLDSVVLSSIPEPSTVSLFGLGIALCYAAKARARKSRNE